MKKVKVAGSAGFCAGVKRSVDMAEKLVSEKENCCSYGEIIHNADVVGELESRGLKVVHEIGPELEGKSVIIRSHGISRDEYEKLGSICSEVIDATCGKVKHIHDIVSRAEKDGEFVFVIGTRNHPEVLATCGWCGGHEVFENPAELESFLEDNPEFSEKNIVTVVQTTSLRQNYEDCIKIIKKRCTNAKIFDTMCFATFTRQEEAANLASVCDAMVVIGGRHSANSVHLADICRTKCGKVLFIENLKELDLNELRNFDTVGVTAGASTPERVIKEVIKAMNEEIKKAENDTELSFDEMLEDSLKTIYNGDKVTGVVAAITGTEISVDLGAKYSGFIPTTEFTDDGIKVEDAVKVGDQIEAVVVRVNDVEGTAMLSKKRLDAAKGWTNLEDAAESGDPVEGTVVEENKGGVVVNVGGVRVFVPASQTDLPRDADLGQLLKEKVKLKITEVNKARKRVVGSIRRVSQAERRERIASLWDNIEVGQKLKGIVKSMTSYGAFVDIGGIDGMIHVSELSWTRIKKPEDVLSVGDEVETYVINFDKDKHRISLGYKDPEADPWKVFTNAYQVGSECDAKVVKLMSFGAFAEIVPGVDGLIHISQLANRRVDKCEDVVKVGDIVRVKITAIDNEKQKVSLSIRALLPSEKEPEPLPEGESAEELVYEVSETGEASGVLPEEDAPAAEEAPAAEDTPEA